MTLVLKSVKVRQDILVTSDVVIVENMFAPTTIVASTTCSSTCAMCSVSYAGRPVRPLPVLLQISFSHSGNGKLHSYRFSVGNRDGKPCSHTASKRYLCSHCQYPGEKVFASKAFAAEQLKSRLLLMAPVTVLKSHLSY